MIVGNFVYQLPLTKFLGHFPYSVMRGRQVGPLCVSVPSPVNFEPVDQFSETSYEYCILAWTVIQYFKILH